MLNKMNHFIAMALFLYHLSLNAQEVQAIHLDVSNSYKALIQEAKLSMIKANYAIKKETPYLYTLYVLEKNVSRFIPYFEHAYSVRLKDKKALVTLNECQSVFRVPIIKKVLYFPSGKADIVSSEREKLEEVYQKMHVDKEKKILFIRANSDAKAIHYAPYKDNMELSYKRALSIQKALEGGNF